MAVLEISNLYERYWMLKNLNSFQFFIYGHWLLVIGHWSLVIG
ncbi:hypothetical protein [Calothrix sp. NIES-2100]